MTDLDTPRIDAVIEDHRNPTIRGVTFPQWWVRTYEFRNWHGVFEDFIVSATTEEREGEKYQNKSHTPFFS